MKKIQFFATALLLNIALFNTGNINAQWNQSATAIYPTTLTKSVGIGTNAPAKALHVNGGLRIENEISMGGANTFEVDAPGVYGGRFKIAANGNIGIGINNPTAHLDIVGGPCWTSYCWKKAVQIDNASALSFRVSPTVSYGIGATSAGDNALYFFTATDGASTPPTYRMALTKNGNLQVYQQAFVGYGSNSGTVDLGFGGEGTGEGIGSKRTAGGNQFGVDLFTDFKSRMSITNAGKVGINTSSPTAKFEVNLLNPNGWAANIPAARFVSPDNAFYLDLKTYVAASGNVGYNFSPNGATGLCITTPGKVGIGISDAAQMPGTYRLYVADGIMTEKVRVALKNTGDWADYVFADDYKLRSLAEVEAFVKENKHLPGVPSAEEVQKTGIDMASMDAKLLEKIEELTLYVIGIQKENESLRKEIEAIKNDQK